MWPWKRMDKISWTDRVRKQVSGRIKEEWNTLRVRKLKRINCNWIDHILGGNCFLKHVTEGKIKGGVVTGRQGRRRKRLLDDFKGWVTLGHFSGGN